MTDQNNKPIKCGTVEIDEDEFANPMVAMEVYERVRKERDQLKAQLTEMQVLVEAAQKFLPLHDAVEPSYSDDVVIRCEVTAGEIRNLTSAIKEFCNE